MIERPCKECGQIFKTFPCVIKEGKGKFCSKKCYTAWQRKAIASGELKLVRPKHLLILHCRYCGKEFQAFPSRKAKYCSCECGYKGNSIKTTAKELRELRYVKKLTLQEIADKLGCEYGTVCRLFKKHGVLSGGGKIVTSREDWRKKHRKRVKAQWQKKLGKRRLNMPICRLVNEDTLVNFVMKNPHVFGYKEVFLYRTSEFDMLGVKNDGTVERVEIEHSLAGFLQHHHPQNCDKVIAYYKTRASLSVPFSLVKPKDFIPFAEEIVLLARKKK